MPEGQVSHYNASVLTEAIAGAPITLVEAPEPRLGPQQIPERLVGDVLERMEARGKHHLFRFRSGRVLHSHLQMQGKWRRFAPGADVPRSGLWLAIHTDRGTVAQYRGPIMRLYEPGARLPRIESLGPDLLAPDADIEGIATRLLTIAPQREVGDAIMDQRVMAGIGNAYKSETLFLAGIDPFREVASLTGDEAEQIARIAALLLAKGVRDRARIVTFPLPREMWRPSEPPTGTSGTELARGANTASLPGEDSAQRTPPEGWTAAERSGERGEHPESLPRGKRPGVRLPPAVVSAGRAGPPGTWVYARARKRCRACGAPIRAQGQGDANRTTYWCPACQR